MCLKSSEGVVTSLCPVEEAKLRRQSLFVSAGEGWVCGGTGGNNIVFRKKGWGISRSKQSIKGEQRKLTAD